MTLDEARILKQNMHICFDSPQGKEVMNYLEGICGWVPSIYDSNETNAIIARDANRRIIGTIKTLLMITPEQIIALESKE